MAGTEQQSSPAKVGQETSMRCVMSLILLLVCSATAVAQTEPPALIVTRSGFYYVVTDDAGVPTLVQVTNVIRIGDAPTPDPGPGPGPTPPPTSVTSQVRAWAAEVNHPIGAQSLALVYETVAREVRDGRVPTSDSYAAIKEASDQVLGTVGGADKWVGFRTKLGELIVTKTQAGELTHANQQAAFFDQVAAGLKGSSAEAPALSPELLNLIIQLVMAILTRLFGGDLGGGGIPGPV